MTDNSSPLFYSQQLLTRPNANISNLITRKIYPIQPVISAAGLIAGTLEFQDTTPSGCICDESRTKIMFDVKVCVAAGTALVTSAPAFNLPATFFTTARYELNDQTVALMNNVARDDTLFKRLTNSYTKYSSEFSNAFMYGSSTDRFNAVQTVLEHEISWSPSILNKYTVLPQNLKSRLILNIHPNLHTAASSPAFENYTNAAADGTLIFYNIYMLKTYIKVDTQQPSKIRIPAYSIKSSYVPLNSTGQTNLFALDKDVYKIAIAQQSSAATVQAGAVVSKFSSGTGVGGAAQSAYSQLLTSLQINFGGNSFPANAYNILETAAVSRSGQCYEDYLGSIKAFADEAGGESKSVWADPKILTDISFGRIFLFDIVRSPFDMNTSLEVTTTCSAAPTTTNLWVFGICKAFFDIVYDSNHQVAQVVSATYD